MKNKNFYSKTWLLCDLLLASVWLLFCSYESWSYSALLMPLSRVWVSFLLFRGSRFSPYAIGFSLLSFVCVFEVHKAIDNSFIYPIRQFIDVFMHFMGCRDVQLINSFIWMPYEDYYQFIAKIFIVLWMVVIPLIVYWWQYKKGTLQPSAISWKKSGLIIIYLSFCLFLLVPALQYEFFYLDFIFFMCIFILLGPIIFKLGDVRNLFTREEILYFVMLVIWGCSIICGDVFFVNRFIVILLVTACFYFLYCWYCSYKVSFVDLLFIFLGGALFVYAEYLTNMERVLFLTLSFIAYFVPIFKFIMNTKLIKSGFVALFIIALVLPVFSLGYNPYAVLEGGRQYKCADCIYSPNGLMYVRNSDYGIVKKGLRDRYGVLIPVEFEELQIVNEYMSYFVVARDGKWNVYDVWGQCLLFGRNYINIDILEDGKLRMQKDFNCYDYYDCHKDVFTAGDIE